MVVVRCISAPALRLVLMEQSNVMGMPLLLGAQEALGWPFGVKMLVTEMSAADIWLASSG